MDMHTTLYNITTIKPKCINHNNGSIIIEDLSAGVLSFSWLDIDPSATVTDNGKAVYKLPCGSYLLKIYHIVNRTHETINIDLSCADELTLDLVHIDETDCYSDTINMYLEWSGGTAPYTIQINDHKTISYDDRYTYIIKPNYSYTIHIIDSNGCSVTKNNIQVQSEPLYTKIHWEPISKHNGVSDMVWCSIRGGTAPYKLAWFNQGHNQPIIVNQERIPNLLKAGNYELVVIDSKGCKHTQRFTISQPPPISVGLTIFNDYSSKALFDKSECETVYNLLLIPTQLTQLNADIINNATFIVQHNKTNTTQKLCLDYGTISIDQQDYQYYYISPGLPQIKSHKISLNINDQTYDLEKKFGSNRSKIVIGSLLIKNDNSFAYKNNDIVRIDCEDGELDIRIDQPYIKNGLYISNNIYTILNMINPDFIDPQGLIFVNKHKNFTTQSLTTKSNQRLGSIICNVVNGDKHSLRATLIDEYGNEENFSFDSKYLLTINNLKYGKYKLLIQDNYSTAHLYNNENITNDYFVINILDSYETERTVASLQSANIFNLDPKLLNNYNYRPNKLLFSDPEFKNGVLMNISPLDACYTITSDNISIEDCGYKIINDLPYGKYNIKIFKEGYKTRTVKLFYNNIKELVTIILEKAIDG